MTTRYALLNPNDGTYSHHATIEDLKVALAAQALAFYMVHTHGAPYSLVCESPDGSETWRTPQGEEMLTVQDLQGQTEKQAAEFLSATATQKDA